MRLLALCARVSALCGWLRYLCVCVYACGAHVWVPTGNSSLAWLAVEAEGVQPQQPFWGCHLQHNASFPTTTCLRSNHSNLQ